MEVITRIRGVLAFGFTPDVIFQNSLIVYNSYNLFLASLNLLFQRHEQDHSRYFKHRVILPNAFYLEL